MDHDWACQLTRSCAVQVPFGGSFYNLVRWCAWTEKGSGKVRLQVSCDVVFTNRWLPAKGIITSSSTEVGMAFQLDVSYLQEIYIAVFNPFGTAFQRTCWTHILVHLCVSLHKLHIFLHSGTPALVLETARADILNLCWAYGMCQCQSSMHANAVWELNDRAQNGTGRSATF